MKLLIACPSKNRFRDDQILRNTWSWLQHSKFDAKVFVEPQDYKEYCKAIGKENVVKTANNISVGGQKVHIANYAAENGYDLIMKVDDDIWCWRDYKNGWYPYSGDKAKGIEMSERKKANAQFVFDKAMDDCLELCRGEKNVGGIAFLFGQMMFHEAGIKWLKLNFNPATCYMSKTELFAPPLCSEIHSFEEFYTWYHTRKEGYLFPLYGKVGMRIDGNLYENAGGFQDFDRKILCAKAVKNLRKAFGDEMIFKKKVNKKADQSKNGGFYVVYDSRKMPLCRSIKVPDDFKYNR